MRFSDLHLSPSLLRAVQEEGYDKPTPIQARAIPPVAEGRDVLGIAQTGTGKTAAFALPILQRLEEAGPSHMQGRRVPRVLVVAPTRELAAQIGESFRTYGRHLRLTVSVVYGGVGQRPQEDELRRGVDILVACPGRLLDLVGQRAADLSGVEILVLDEADRMLDMGFLPDIRKIVRHVPQDRQTLFFSATMPEEIQDLVSGLLRDPVTVQVAPSATSAETVDQSFQRVSRESKPDALEDLIRGVSGRTLVFTRTKHGADRVAKRLERSGVPAQAIHGDKSQGARTKAIDGFKTGAVEVLVASDIAARGLDIDEIRLVVNYDVPVDPDTYVHRIGRTGRAGATGRAVTFVTDDEGDAARDIEKRIGRKVEWIGSDSVPPGRGTSAPKAPQQQRSRGREGHAQGQRASPRRSNAPSNAPPGQKPARQAGGDRARREVGERSRGSAEPGRRGQSAGSGEGGPRSRNRRRGSPRPGSSSPSQGRPAEEKPNLIGRLWNRLKGGRT